MIEKLTNRLNELNIQLQQAQGRLQQANADAIAISGAIQEVSYWISKEESDENKTETKTCV